MSDGTQTESFDYIVVGSGAGGGVVAARLALAGKQVLLLEAGGNTVVERGPTDGHERDVNLDYSVPAFHAFASEHPAIRWDFWVHHYDDPQRRARDPKYDAARDGVLYPRCSTLGGCTAHHANIIVRPHNADWNHIWQLTGDRSWRASNMGRYFRRLERCRHRSLFHRLAAWLGWNPSGHGFGGWLQTEKALPLRPLLDWRMRRMLKQSVLGAFDRLPGALARWRWLVVGQGDPNDERLLDGKAFGVRYIPLSTAKHARVGTRELLHDTLLTHGANLTIRVHALVTKVEIDRESKRATGVVYREGERLYGAAPGAGETGGAERKVAARSEVILAGGTFNTPQLLMLSGVGDAEQLHRHDIEAIVDLPGVGKNLQDRYEVGVVNRMKQPWKAMQAARYAPTDRPFKRWKWLRKGLYTSNGGVLAVIAPSRSNLERPDLFCLGLLADFRGYHPGYSERTREPDYMTWVVLKAHTNNTAGEVALQSADPTAPPAIRFRYFEEGNDASGDDLRSVVSGVRFVRTIADSITDLIDEEETPGRHLYTDEQIAEHVRDAAWGHHACGTCAMKPREDGGVVDSEFRVHGVDGLRVVDASIFPRIPGFFIVTSVYMIAEKAADILSDQAKELSSGCPRQRGHRVGKG